MNADCREHSKSLELLSLRNRVARGIPDPDELEETEKRIRVLERELRLD